MPIATEIIPIGPHSDGDPSHVPSEGWNLVDPPHIYLNKIAEQWMSSRGNARPGVKYYLDRLPAGYRLYEKPRPNNPKIIDKHLYGHPGRGRKYFDSPNRFYPHFEHLMNNRGSNVGCPCNVCAGRSSTPIGSGTIKEKVPKPINMSSGPATQARVDEENTPDTIRHLIDKLKHGPVDQIIFEEFSLDWSASKKALDKWLARTKTQPSWLPRQGEIVLFVRDLSGSQIDYDNAAGTYKIFSEKEDRFIGRPRWEAGVIGQGPSETVTLEEIIYEIEKTQNVAYSGFRVEPLSNPNGSDKSLSKRYKYVPLHQIRPFAFWQEYLKGIPGDAWHPTIQNALTVASSVVLVDKNRFQGVWPGATIFCGGIYIGFEFIGLGDTVRLTPEKGDTVSDFLEVTSIKIRLTNLDNASGDDYDDGHPYNTAVTLAGRAFTLDQSKAWNGIQLSSYRLPPKGMDGYDIDSLYWLHEPTKKYQVSFNRVLGRCYDAHPMMMWFPSAGDSDDTATLLSNGVAGIQAARIFSSQTDVRISSGKTWYWGDTRLEVLGAETLNSVHSSSHDEMREERLDEWQDYTKALMKGAQKGGIEAVRSPKRTGESTMAAAAAVRAAAAATSGSEDELAYVGDEAETRKRSYTTVENEVSTLSHRFNMPEDDNDGTTDSDATAAAPTRTPLEAFKRPKLVVYIDN